MIAKADRGTYSKDGTIGSRLVIGEVDVENQGVVVAETWIGREREKRRHSIYPPHNKMNKKKDNKRAPLPPSVAKKRTDEREKGRKTNKRQPSPLISPHPTPVPNPFLLPSPSPNSLLPPSLSSQYSHALSLLPPHPPPAPGLAPG